MKALLYKDWITHRFSYLLLLGMILLVLLFGPLFKLNLEFLLGWSASIVIIGAVAGGMAGQTTDMKSHVDRYVQAVPLRKSVIVLEKFLWNWAIALLATGLVAAALLVPRIEAPVWLIAAACLFGMTFFSSLMTPSAYLLGPDMAFIPYAVVFMLFGLGATGLAKSGILNEEFFASLSDKTDAITIGFLVATVALNAASFFVTQAIYRRKVN
ncbi:ABC-2 transporter permease [Mobiluncus porci]|uniref:ABC-2 transporter permease n=1 Tax=Mobiluncus porci TaxID=2652278 RepID=A0A7K0K1E9_9ACTO|nr:ABC-2 transporter permease [Mobiluncus porci]MST49317.1 ABC-2 transporter permease [Mobiluncus porci]